jgi:hypothetical protein
MSSGAGLTGNTEVVRAGSETGTSFITGTVMLTWDSMGGTGDGTATVDCGFSGAGVSGSKPQYLVSSPKGMAQLTVLASIAEASTGILNCTVVAEDATTGNVFVKWTGGIGHSVNAAETPNDFTVATTTPTSVPT